MDLKYSASSTGNLGWWSPSLKSDWMVWPFTWVSHSLSSLVNAVSGYWKDLDSEKTMQVLSRPQHGEPDFYSFRFLSGVLQEYRVSGLLLWASGICIPGVKTVLSQTCLMCTLGFVQSLTLSLYLFMIFMDRILRQGLKVRVWHGSREVTSLFFADVDVILAPSQKSLQRALKWFALEREAARMRINTHTVNLSPWGFFSGKGWHVPFRWGGFIPGGGV